MNILKPLSTLAAVVVLAACAGTAGGPPPEAAPLTLHIAHINDHHSQLDPQPGAELLLEGRPTRVSLGGFARITRVFRELEASTPHLLKLHAGDAITGTLYYTFFRGAADARLMNTVCFDAFVLGNHEFDDGDQTLRGFLDELAQGDCQTPVLAANVLPAPGSPLAPDGSRSPLRPHTIKTVGGVRVGIVGIDIVDKTVNASRPLASTRFLDEVETAQREIDALRRQGVEHIVLLTHQGYGRDQAMAARLSGVDVIIGGDSHSLLGDFSALGLSSAGAYPTQVRNRDGDTVCIGQAWEYAKAVGLMRVAFDRAGRVLSCGGQASLVIGEPFARQDAQGKWAPMSAAEQAALVQGLQAQPALRVVAPDARASEALLRYASRVETEKARHIGQASEALCLVRVPGEATNRSASVAGCEAANTLARGSDAAQAVAEAFLATSRRASIALQNAGGVRVPIPAGSVSMNTAVSMLPFTNTLVELDLSGAEIRAALEDAVSNHLDRKSSDGSHPYAAGLRWDLDMSQPKGRRFANLQVRDRTSGQYRPLDGGARYTVVTNDFIASGKDGYTTLGQAYAQGRFENTYLLYTQSFADHLVARQPLTRPARGDYAHQKVISATGQALP